MSGLLVVFILVSTIFALGTLGYVAIDILIEMRKKEEPKETVEIIEIKEEPEVPVVEEPEPEVMPEIVEQIDAEQADAMISDTLAMQTVNYESGAGRGQQGIINIGILDDNFNENDVITLAVLKEKGLISKKAGRMKVLADGILNKPLTIKAENYSIQAIKMVELTGGKIIILKD